ncbi:hypothetical protein CBR_g40202 [Chara braunii]|uniref:Uncharacterized protein n=1 Tax=Chara braunii TaxID=69332 RepID=A0A388LTB8_CHABU|nr:hypothetical protein CBR_g40202 [Chara braunii]|eukprot:GBG85564.1 hypothetical protein CBR_g40202 [Chara braunii]
MGRSRTRSRCRSPTRRSKKDDLRRARSPARRTDRSPDRSNDEKLRRCEKRRLRSSSTSSRRQRHNLSSDRGRNDWQDDRRSEFALNKPAPGNRVWFTVDLSDEMYALRRELYRLRKRVDKLSDEFRAQATKKPAGAITADMLKQAVDKAVLGAMSESGKKIDVGRDQSKRIAKAKTDEAARMATLKRQLEDMKELRYDLANLQGQINAYKSPLTKPFTSLKPRAPLNKTPKKTPNAIGAGPSGVKKPVV